MNHNIDIDPRLQAEAADQPHPLLFVTISGAHLYGFPSPDSDFDLRGAHLLPLEQIVGLKPGRETIEVSRMRDGLHMDFVTHDARKFFGFLMKNNGYAVEQVLSPLVVHTSEAHQELKAIARRSVGKMHARHYFGFAQNQWKIFEKTAPHRVKPLLYIYRVLLTGIHLMRSGQIEANLVTLNEEFQSPQVGDLIARKTSEPEQTTLPAADMSFYAAEYERLRTLLQDAETQSHLPDVVSIRDELHDLLLRLRLN